MVLSLTHSLVMFVLLQTRALSAQEHESLTLDVGTLHELVQISESLSAMPSEPMQNTNSLVGGTKHLISYYEITQITTITQHIIY